MNIDLDVDNLHLLSIEYGLAAIGIASPQGLVSKSLSWAKTAICCALAYPHISNSTHPIGTGNVASFSMGPDYHQVLSNRLHKLAHNMFRDIPVSYTIHVDDPQISERALALQAGLGWIGRNKCLFVSGYGSYVVLGEILIDTDCPIPSVVQHQKCGACTICIQACPSNALCKDCGLIWDRCISHITQSRGIISSDLMSVMGDHIYGCDVCQSVCPYNQLPSHNDPEMTIQCYPGPNPHLIDIIQLTSAQWKHIVQPTSMGWIGRNAWRRNAIIAAANQGFLSAIDSLTSAVSDPNEVVSATAEWGLEHMFSKIDNIP